MRDIMKASADIDVQIVFCNAGYILSGFFYSRQVATAAQCASQTELGLQRIGGRQLLYSRCMPECM